MISIIHRTNRFVRLDMGETLSHCRYQKRSQLTNKKIDEPSTKLTSKSESQQCSNEPTRESEKQPVEILKIEDFCSKWITCFVNARTQSESN
uniref:Uncharacterized protein n=1 Tax=Romanomermis culicivorax TaxID=13658 RepID=A0A915K6K7_ROMCU